MKRIFASLLVVCLMLGAIPLAYAGDSVDIAEGEAIETEGGDSTAPNGEKSPTPEEGLAPEKKKEGAANYVEVQSLDELLVAIDNATDGDTIAVNKELSISKNCTIGDPEKTITIIPGPNFSDNTIFNVYYFLNPDIIFQNLIIDGNKKENVSAYDMNFYLLADSTGKIAFENTSIRDVISSVKDAGDGDCIAETPASIVIYKEELEKIESLEHDDTERLAFVFLCAAKMLPYRWIYECNAELYRLAWRYKYDAVSKKVLGRQQGRRVGGSEPTKRVNRICQAGIVHYITRINTSYKLTHSAPPASASFTVPILCDSGEVAFVINKPDMESLVLYYDRYKGYSGLITCQCCGCPALRTGRRQKYCISCADEMNHNPEKRAL